MMTHEMFGPVGSPRYLDYARHINESGSHLLELINSILDVSKVEAGRFTLAPDTFDLAEVAGQALRFVKLQAERGAVALSADIAPDAAHIRADRRAVLQILINLHANGVKFTPRKGSVVVRATRCSRAIALIVRDSGTGIAPEDLQRLGRPFEQADNAYTRGREGTGLGLALVRSLAQLHGGAVRIESSLGEGTTVTVMLPDAIPAVVRGVQAVA